MRDPVTLEEKPAKCRSAATSGVMIAIYILLLRRQEAQA